MDKYDRAGTLFFLGLAALICLESYRLGLGSFSQPGPGLLPWGSGLILGVFAFIVLVRPSRGKGERENLRGQGAAWRRIIYILASLAAYASFLNSLGFLLINFLWMGFVCWKIGGMGWKVALFTSLTSTFFAYLLFEYYLSIRFPRGVLGI